MNSAIIVGHHYWLRRPTALYSKLVPTPPPKTLFRLVRLDPPVNPRFIGLFFVPVLQYLDVEYRFNQSMTMTELAHWLLTPSLMSEILSLRTTTI